MIESVIANIVGDVTSNDSSNLYFPLLFFNAEGNMLEADIYMAVPDRD
ncbi:MAG: hypothetical protein JEZ06_15245 [Anaerolineaceae bacterium]|nr:hypothetical protein [Anaerolineaceae bacterium]